MVTNVAWFLAGLAALIIGSEFVVRGGSRMAHQLGVGPIVIGLTVVSIGTSVPELAIGVVAATEGSASLAVGNITGTNVVNLLLILGLSALIRPLAMQMRTLRIDLPIMAAAALLLWGLALNGTLSRLDGLVLVLCAIVYTVVVIRTSRRESPQALDEFSAEYGEDKPEPSQESAGGGLARNTVLLAVGIAIIVVGADWLVDGAVGAARGWGGFRRLHRPHHRGHRHVGAGVGDDLGVDRARGT
jgi:cation:H+ antiporter